MVTKQSVQARPPKWLGILNRSINERFAAVHDRLTVLESKVVGNGCGDGDGSIDELVALRDGMKLAMKLANVEGT